MKEEKLETGLDSRVLVQKAEVLPLPGKRQVRPGRLDSKRKPKAKKTCSSADNTSFIGQIIHGVVDGLFDAGYLLTVRVGDTDTLLRGVLFEPGLSVPISEVNDIAPNVKLAKREKNVPFPEELHTSNAMPHGQCSHIMMLPAPVPNDVPPSCFPTPEKIGSDRIDMGCHQQKATPSQSTSISEDISRLTSLVPFPNPITMSSLHVQNQVEPPTSKGSDQTYVEAPQLNEGPSSKTTFTLKADSKLLPSAFVSEYGVPKSVNLQSRMDSPGVIGSGKTDIVLPHPGAIPSESTSGSQPVPVPMPIPNAPLLAVQTGTRLPATTRFGQTDLLTLPDTTSTKFTPISEAASGFPSSMLKMDASAPSSTHVQYQMGPPVAIGSCQTDMVTPQPDAVPLKSACISIGVSIPSLISDANAQPTSSAHAEKIKPLTVTGFSQTDTMAHQEDAIRLTSSFISQDFSTLPSPMLAPDNLAKSSDNAPNQVEPLMTSSSDQPDVVCSQPEAIPSKSMCILQDMPVSSIPMLVQHTQTTSSVCVQDQMGSPVIIGCGQTGMVSPQSGVILLQSTSISQTVSTMPGLMPFPNAPLSSSVAIQKQIDSLAGFACGQTYSVACQPDTSPTISASVSQALPMLSSSMPIQYSRGGSILVQNQSGPPSRTVSGQTDIVVPLPELISPKTISVPKNSAHREHGGQSGSSEQLCESMVVTETRMDVDKSA